MNKENVPPKRNSLRRTTSVQSEFKTPVRGTPRRACKDEALVRIFSSMSPDSPKNETIMKAKHAALFSNDDANDPLASPTRRLRALSITPSRAKKPPVKPVVPLRRLTEIPVKRPVSTPKDADFKPTNEESSSSDDESPSSTSSSDNNDHSIDEELYQIVQKSKRNVKSRARRKTTATTSRANRVRVEKERMDTLISESGCLPCRESEFEQIYEFVMDKLVEGSGGCLYIAGLPGTGKTATVNAVLGSVQRELKAMNDNRMRVVQVNGMHVTEPKQIYIQIYQQLTGVKTSAKNAAELLEREFCTANSCGGGRGRRVRKPKEAEASTGSCVLVVDELDLLCTKRQDVLYSLFDWPTRPAGRRALIVLCIANTMDLPERMLQHRVASRLGLSRLIFAPYSHEQLVTIVKKRIFANTQLDFESRAVELAARKVAAVSGDARKAMEICRRAVELAEEEGTAVGMKQIDRVLKEMFTTPKVHAIRNATSQYERMFLKALISEMRAKSSDETRFALVHEQLNGLCRLEGRACLTQSELFHICGSLGAHKLLFVEPSSRDQDLSIRLNCAISDIVMALKS